MGDRRRRRQSVRPARHLLITAVGVIAAIHPRTRIGAANLCRSLIESSDRGNNRLLLDLSSWGKDNEGNGSARLAA
jgi:hypothetical protein